MKWRLGWDTAALCTLILQLVLDPFCYCGAWNLSLNGGGGGGSSKMTGGNNNSNKNNNKPTTTNTAELAAATAAAGTVLLDISTSSRTTNAFVETTIDTTTQSAALLELVSDTNAIFVHYLRQVYAYAHTIILYRPPVGVVLLFGLHRIYTKLRSSPTTVQEIISNQESKRTKGRKFFLDTDDADYNHHGGIDHVRAKLCRAALGGGGIDDENDGSDGDDDNDARCQLAVQGLEVTHRPGDSRLRLVQELAGPLSHLTRLLEDETKSNKNNVNKEKKMILTMARTVLHVRAVDALLRIARDRLLKVAFRLQRTCDHYEHRLQYLQSYYPSAFFIQRFFKNTITADQARLSAATAAYHAELKRLGEIAQVLADRPGDMGQDYLIRALKETDEIQRREKTAQQQQERIHKHGSSFLASWAIPTPLAKLKMPHIGQYRIRWNVEGRGRFSLRKMEPSDGQHIDADTATRALLSDGFGGITWLRQSDQWTRRARSKLGEILQLVHDDSVGESQFDRDSFELVQNYWCTGRNAIYVDDNNNSGIGGSVVTGQDLWLKALRLVDGLHSDRRVGEGKALRLQDAALVGWTRRLDYLGIPSTVLAFTLAGIVHDRLTPYWPAFLKDSLAAYNTLLGIVRERFWFPVKSILDDLMNKSPTMMSAFGLDIEETSLDNMLRDLGYGDGSPEMRREGLKIAAEHYEDYLQKGVVGNLVRGNLVRLMLIQVQQLKVGVLSALETVDILMKGNRIYFSILAGIPAVVLATYGTKFLLHFMYNIRSRDIRPVKTVHEEMKDLLAYTEEIILLANHNHVAGGATRLALQSLELGQLLLTVHRYLILLDYSSPPFPSAQCDQIHENLRKLFGTDGILTRAMDDGHRTMWIQLVQKKHHDLLRYL
jgi:nuclear control of ATPase protein 2